MGGDRDKETVWQIVALNIEASLGILGGSWLHMGNGCLIWSSWECVFFLVPPVLERALVVNL